MSNNLEQFRTEFLEAMRNDILSVDPADSSPEAKILQSAMLKAYDFVDQYQALTTERTAMILAMTSAEFASWINLPRNQFALVETLSDAVAVEIIFLDASASNVIVSSVVAMAAVAASATAMAAVLGSSLAFNRIIKNDAARTALVNDATSRASLNSSRAALETMMNGNTGHWEAVSEAAAYGASPIYCGASANNGASISVNTSNSYNHRTNIVAMITRAGYYSASGSRTFTPKHLQNTAQPAGSAFSTSSGTDYTASNNNNTVGIGGLQVELNSPNAGVYIKYWKAK
jgi:hypothetical protein